YLRLSCPGSPCSLIRSALFMRRILFFVPLCLLAGVLPLIPAQRPASLTAGVFAIREARIVVAPGKVLESGTVVIREGIIDAVGADVKVPVDAIVIEAKGQTVYPGFVDAATNQGYDATQRKSAVGDPATEDIAGNVLATTKPDHRKGITPDFQVRAALKA